MSSKQIISGILEIIKTLAIVITMAFILKTFFIQTFIIDGQSMEPNFHNKEYLLIDKLTYHFRNPKRGDVIILVPPGDESKDYIKRVIGLPGETVEITNNQVRVNGVLIKEPYLKPGEITQVAESTDSVYKLTLDQSHYFVLGDNRRASNDSRAIGPIPRSNILGRTFIVLFPFGQFRLIRHFNYVNPVSSLLLFHSSSQS